MNINYREYRPGKFQIYFSYHGKQVFIQKKFDGSPMKSIQDVRETISIINSWDGYDLSDKDNPWIKDKSFLFENAVQTWISLSTCSPDWLRERERLAQSLLIPFFQKKDIRNIKTIDIDEFHKSLQSRGVSAKYIKNILGELKTFFRFYKKSIPELPEFRRIKVQRKVTRWLEVDNQDKVFEFLPEEHLPIFTFLRCYPCRLNEACGILKPNVIWEHSIPKVVIDSVIDKRGRLRNNTKTYISKELPILTELEWVFKPKDEGSPFLFSWKGQPYTSKKLYRIWNRASSKANNEYGVPIINVYNAMKHSFGWQRLDQGFSYDEVGAAMGLASNEMVKRYAQYKLQKLINVIRGRSVHKLFIPDENYNILNLNQNMVGGTGIEPATSGL